MSDLREQYNPDLNASNGDAESKPATHYFDYSTNKLCIASLRCVFFIQTRVGVKIRGN